MKGEIVMLNTQISSDKNQITSLNNQISTFQQHLVKQFEELVSKVIINHLSINFFSF